MATEPRVLSGIGLTSFFPDGYDGWKPDMDNNLLRASYLAQLSLNQAPSTALPASPADGFIAVDPSTKEVCVRDADAWVRIAPKAGWLAAFNRSLYSFTGSIWVTVLAATGRLDNTLMPLSVALDATTNANDVIDPGVYYSNSDAQMTLALNWPEQLASTVFVQRATTGNSQVTQIVVTRNGTGGVCNIYTRVRFGGGAGTWGGWKKLAINGDPVNFANIKLGNILSTDINTLDYYEEGSFTPTIAGSTTAGTGTIAVAVGDYTRVGRMIQVNMIIQWSGHTGVGNMNIGGWPYAAGGPTASVLLAYPSAITLGAGYTACAAQYGANTSICQLAQFGSGIAASLVPMQASGLIRVTGTYRVA